MSKPSSGIVAIVVYKAATAVLLAATSASLLLAIKHQEELQQFSGALTLAGKRGIIAWFLEKILNFNPRTLQFSGIAAGVYAVLTTIEALGLWYQKTWARWLVLGFVGISIVPEIFELTKGFSVLKLVAFLANIVIFFYLLRKFPKSEA